MLFDYLGIYKPKNKTFFSLATIMIAILSIAMFFVSPFCIVAIPLIAVLAYVLYKTPAIGLYIITFLFPYHGISFKVLSNFNLQFIDAFTLFFIVIILAKYLFTYLFDRANFNKIKFPVLKVFALFFFSGLISVINSLNISFSFVYLIRFIAFCYIAYVVLPTNILKNKKELHNVIFTLLLTSIITVGIQFLYIYKEGFNIDFRGQISSITFKDIYPFGENHNLLAEVYTVGIFAAMYLFYVAKNMTWRFVYTLSIIVLSIADLFILSRSAFLAVLVAVSFLFIVYPFIRENKSLKTAAFEIGFRTFSMIALIVVCLGFYTNFINQISANEVKSSSDARVDMTKSSFVMFMSNPIIGNGVANFKMLLGNDSEYIKNYYVALDSHGVIQKIIVEQGIVGVITFALFIIALIVMYFKAIKNIANYDDRMSLSIIFALFIAALFLQLFNTTYYTYRLWLPIGLFIVASRIYSEKKIIK